MTNTNNVIFVIVYRSKVKGVNNPSLHQSASSHVIVVQAACWLTMPASRESQPLSHWMNCGSHDLFSDAVTLPAWGALC